MPENNAPTRRPAAWTTQTLASLLVVVGGILLIVAFASHRAALGWLGAVVLVAAVVVTVLSAVNHAKAGARARAAEDDRPRS